MMNILDVHTEKKLLYFISKESDDSTFILMFLNGKKEENIIKEWFNKIGEDIFILAISSVRFNKKEQELLLDTFGTEIKKSDQNILVKNFSKIKEKIKIDDYFESLKKNKNKNNKKKKENNNNKFNTDFYYLVYNKKYLCSFIIDNPTQTDHSLLIENHLGFTLFHKFKKKFYQKSLKKLNSLLNSEHDSEKSLKETINFINKKFNRNSNKEITLEHLIKTYIKENYKISDNIKNRLSASFLCSEIENHLINLKKNGSSEDFCLKDFIKGKVRFRNNLSKILLSLDLKKKRFQDGFYYYGLESMSDSEKRLFKYCNINNEKDNKIIDISNLKVIGHNTWVDSKTIKSNDYELINQYDSIVLSQYMVFDPYFLKLIKKKWKYIAIKVKKKEKRPNTSHIYSGFGPVGFYKELIKIIFNTFKYSNISLIITRKHRFGIEEVFKNSVFLYEPKIPMSFNVISLFDSKYTRYLFYEYKLPEGGRFSINEKNLDKNILDKNMIKIWTENFDKYNPISDKSKKVIFLKRKGIPLTSDSDNDSDNESILSLDSVENKNDNKINIKMDSDNESILSLDSVENKNNTDEDSDNDSILSLKFRRM